VPVICEIYGGKPANGPLSIYPDGIQRVYWSRAHTAPEIYRTNIIGEPLVIGLAKLAQASDPDIRRGAMRSLRRLCPDDPHTRAVLIEALQDTDSICLVGCAGFVVFNVNRGAKSRPLLGKWKAQAICGTIAPVPAV
jgi:hypothetical protein